MIIKEVPLDSLTIPDYCKRHHSADQIDLFIKGLKKHDQYQPIIVSDGEILCGVLIYLSLKKLGKEKCFINELGPLSLEKKKEIRYLDNQIFDIEDWEEKAIKEFLMGLEIEDLEKYGFTGEEAEIIINMEPETLPTVETKSSLWQDQWECDSCGWTGTIEK